MQMLVVLVTALTVLVAGPPREHDLTPHRSRGEPSRDQRHSGLPERRQGERRLKRDAISAVRRLADFNVDSVRDALEDLSSTFGSDYPEGQEYLERLGRLENEARAAADDQRAADVLKRLRALRRRALVAANPVLAFDELLVLKRKRGQHGLPVNHKCNSGIERSGYDNEIAIVSKVRSDCGLTTLFRPRGGWFVGEMDLHFDADRLLFTMPDARSWRIHEIRTDGTGLRQVSPEEPCVDHFDGAYLPDGGIVFSSTGSFHAVPCWHGRERACTIYRMDASGSNVRQLCFDQDLDLHPSVLPNGQIIFNRWDYTGPLHMYLAPLMVMNPDGTEQRALYGSNSYWPNRLYFSRGIPGDPGRIVAIAAGYHGPPRMGVPVLIDIGRGWHGRDGLIQFIPRRDEAFDGSVKVDTWYSKVWPKYLHPYPLTAAGHRGAGKYFLVAMQPTRSSTWGIYLIDVFDNVVPLLVSPQWDFFEPIPLKRTAKPPVIPDRTDSRRNDAVMYVHDVYRGRGLKGVPRGTIHRLRVVAYHFGFPGLAGPDKVGLGGPWDVMRILGTVPVDSAGSAAFRVPADTPLALQPLDAEGKAVQLMRSWTTAMPGESVGCVGCHEETKDAPLVGTSTRERIPDEIEPWYGPPRGFDFEREVQPVLDRYCTSCHNGRPRESGRTIPDLRAELQHPDYGGHPMARLGAQRLHPAVEEYLGGQQVRYTPAYEALLPFVRRVGIEDEVSVLVPGEYHADTSELVQMLRKGHHGVRLDAEAWDRLVTWIDLNAPCHGTWSEVAPIPERADRRRREMQLRCGGPSVDFEAVPDLSRDSAPVALPAPPPVYGPAPRLPGWPFDATEARRRQRADGRPIHRSVELGSGLAMKLVRIPAGRFVMGDSESDGSANAAGEADERPATVVEIAEPFWIGAYEVTGAQYRRFDPEHRTGYFTKRYPGVDGPGLALDGPEQPVIRVSWMQAMAFCRWLAERSGLRVTLPTEAQWEYACRAGTATAMSYGAVGSDFSRYANLADRALAIQPPETGGLTSAIVNPFLGARFSGIMLDSVFGGDIPCSEDYADGYAVTAEVGRFAPNAWGLYDLHGNVAEWTRTTYRGYPYAGEDDRHHAAGDGEKVVRGGSFRDRPHRARSAFRLSYPAWQRVHNVGFRIIIEDECGDATDR